MTDILKYILIFFISVGYSQNAKDSLQIETFKKANEFLLNRDFENAYYLYYQTNEFNPNTKIGEKAILKSDSLRTILREELHEKIIGIWKLESSTDKTDIKSIEITKISIKFRLKSGKTKVEKIAFKNNLKRVKNYFEIKFADRTNWVILKNDEYLILKYTSESTDIGDIQSTDGNEELIFKKPK